MLDECGNWNLNLELYLLYFESKLTYLLPVTKLTRSPWFLRLFCFRYEKFLIKNLQSYWGHFEARYNSFESSWEVLSLETIVKKFLKGEGGQFFKSWDFGSEKIWSNLQTCFSIHSIYLVYLMHMNLFFPDQFYSILFC